MSYVSIIQQYENELIDLRRHFHRFPELANEEHETADYVESYLRDCGLEVRRGLAKTGLIGILKGAPGASIAFRTEMDGLPIHEENRVDYRSTRENIMHACGHDGHMAVTLVTAKILSQAKERLNGNVLFIFQPAEENLPAGGAKRMFEDGAELFRDVHAIFGFHFWPSLETGAVAVSEGSMMAAGDVFEVNFSGVGAHGANPYQSSDVLMMTSEAALALTSIALRSIEPGTFATMSVGVISGGKYPNVLPSRSMIKGTTRYVDERFKEYFPEIIQRVINGICQTYSGKCQLNYQYGYPLLKNNPKLGRMVLNNARMAKTVNKVIEVTTPSLTSEDFAVYLEKIPGCYYWVGTQNKSNEVTNSLHNPRFDLDESALLTAVEMYLLICKQMLNLLRVKNIGKWRCCQFD